jgi:hypothetical protein
MGKPKHSNDPRGEQKGAQTHAEGQHGAKAYEARKAEINDHGQQRGGHPGQSERAQHDPRSADGSDAQLHERKIANPELERDGGHRLFENRTQHDHAEKHSEQTRRQIDVQRHGHDADDFQIPGGHTGHPATTPDHAHAKVKSTGEGGGMRSPEEHGDTGNS